MISSGTANQLIDIKRLGIKNKFGEKLYPKGEVSINPEWEELVVKEGYFNSIGLTNLYYKDKEINTKDKYHTPYRSYLLDVCNHKNIIVTQCVDTDRIYLKIVGNPETIEDLEDQLRPDYRIEGVTDEEIIEENRRDLQKHKRIKTIEAKFNNSPEKLDKNGQVITNIDHYDNYFYEIDGSCEGIIYKILNFEPKRIWLEEKLAYLEDRYEKFIEDCDREKAIHALGSLSGNDDEMFLFRKTGKFIMKKMEMICFETGLNPGQVWAAWKYIELQEMEETMEKIKDELKRIDNIGL